MVSPPDLCRREAEHIERLAKCISLLADRQVLLAQAQALRQQADDIEARGAVCANAPLSTWRRLPRGAY